MKKLLCVISALVFLVFCSCSDENYKDISKECNVSPSEPTNVVSNNFYFKSINNVLEYNWGSYNYRITFDLPKISIHTNGYVIIISIEFDHAYGYNFTETENTYKDYIESINNRDSFKMIDYKGEIVTFANKEFEGNFRTAEAIIMACIHYKTDKIDVNQVIEFAIKMKGRKYGISLEESLY